MLRISEAPLHHEMTNLARQSLRDNVRTTVLRVAETCELQCQTCIESEER